MASANDDDDDAAADRVAEELTEYIHDIEERLTCEDDLDRGNLREEDE